MYDVLPLWLDSTNSIFLVGSSPVCFPISIQKVSTPGHTRVVHCRSIDKARGSTGECVDERIVVSSNARQSPPFNEMTLLADQG